MEALRHDLGRLYGGSWFKNRRHLNWRAPIIADAIVEIWGSTISVLDMGCGHGDIINELDKRGLRPVGLEGSPAAPGYCDRRFVTFADLRDPIDLQIEFDLVMSLEVAEHIEEEFVNVYLDNLCRHGKRILITAAQPGQGGVGHFNCQPQGYWIDHFWGRGYFRRAGVEDLWKTHLLPWKNKKGIKAYYDNVLYFEKGDLCSKS